MTLAEITEIITKAVSEAASMKPLPHGSDNYTAHLSNFSTTPANSATIVLGRRVRIDL